jgi:hypothetical protein
VAVPPARQTPLLVSYREPVLAFRRDGGLRTFELVFWRYAAAGAVHAAVLVVHHNPVNWLWGIPQRQWQPCADVLTPQHLGPVLNNSTALKTGQQSSHMCHAVPPDECSKVSDREL